LDQKTKATSRRLSDRVVSDNYLLKQIDRTVSEVFKGSEFRGEELKCFLFPSTSANYVNSRCNGGSVTDISLSLKAFMAEYSETLGNLPEYEFGVSHEKYRYWHEFSKTLIKSFEFSRTDLGYSYMRCVDVSGEFRDATRLYVHDWTQLEKRYFDFYRWCVNKAHSEVNGVIPIGLKEALKVRIITKCPPLLMYVMKPIQKWMSKVLKKFRIFRLTGEECSVELISECMRPELPKGAFWLSGDYSAATDNLKKRFSERCGIAIGKFIVFDHYLDNKLVKDLRDLLLRSLTGFSFQTDMFSLRSACLKGYIPDSVLNLSLNSERYKDWENRREEAIFDTMKYYDISRIELLAGCDDRDYPYDGWWKEKNPSNCYIPADGILQSERHFSIVYDQKDGQLMGSVTSFCVLCLINATLCRLSMEIGNDKTIKIDSDIQLLINGDDCIFLANHKVRLAWLWLGPRLGLKPSLGKYYYSREFLQINSRTFRPMKFPRVRSRVGNINLLYTFILEKFVSMGLVTGVSRSSSDNAELFGVGYVQKVGDVYNKNMSQSPSYVRKDLHLLYTHTLRRCIPFCGIFIPWYVPYWWGGLGMNPKYANIEVKEFDARLIRGCLRADVSIPTLKQEDAWKFAKIVRSCVAKRYWFKTNIEKSRVCDADSEVFDTDEKFKNFLRFQMMTHLSVDELVNSSLLTESDSATKCAALNQLKIVNNFWKQLGGSKRVDQFMDLWSLRPHETISVRFNPCIEEVWDRAIIERFFVKVG